MASTEGEIGPERAAELMSYRDRQPLVRGTYVQQLEAKAFAELELAAIAELRAEDASRPDSFSANRRRADVHLARAQVFATLTVANATGVS